MSKWFVSRQKYWGVPPEDGTVVEIAAGGRDYANPDMMAEGWIRLGEGQEYTDPREAVEAAIRVCNAWRQSGEKKAKIAMGSTCGNTIPFEPTTYKAARVKAQELYDKLPRCTQCGDILGDETYTHELVCDDEKFCSDRCAEKHYDSTIVDTTDEDI